MARPDKKIKKPGKQLITKQNGYYLAPILLLTFILYSVSFGNYFIINWDDDGYILNNPMIRDISWKGIKTIFTTNHIDNYHPLTTLSNAIEYHFFELNPKPYRVVNILFHMANTVLVFIFIFQLLKSKEAAALSALFFAIHPMHVESVTWIAERKDVLYTFFFMASLILYNAYLREKKNSLLAWSLVLMLLSCLSKPAAVVLGPALFLLDYYSGRKISARIILEKIPFFALSVLFGVLALRSQGSSGSMDIAPEFPLYDKFFLSSYALLFYIIKAIVPLNLSALFLYPEKNGAFFPIEYYVAPITLILIAWAIFRSVKIRKELIVGSLFYSFSLAMVIQVISVGRAIVAERYSYVPYIGLFFILSRFYLAIKNKELAFSSKLKPFVNPIILILCILFSISTWNRNKAWKDSATLFTDVINKQPENYYGYYARGVGKSLMNDVPGAIQDFSSALKLNPNHVDSWYNNGVMKEKLKDKKGAYEDYNRAIQSSPGYNKAWYNRGNVRYEMGDYKGAIGDFTQTVKLKPDHFEAYCNRGVARLMLKDSLGAMQDYNAAITLNPKLSNALYNRGNLHFNLKHYKEACEDYHKAVKEGYIDAQKIIDAYCKPRGL